MGQVNYHVVFLPFFKSHKKYKRNNFKNAHCTWYFLHAIRAGYTFYLVVLGVVLVVVRIDVKVGVLRDSHNLFFNTV
jgi:hypothetical protein